MSCLRYFKVFDDRSASLRQRKCKGHIPHDHRYDGVQIQLERYTDATSSRLLIHSTPQDCKVYKTSRVSATIDAIWRENALQCRVASDGRGIERDEVILSELAPCSSSVLMLRSQNGKNLSRVFVGLAFATHSTSWWIARTAFDRTFCVA